MLGIVLATEAPIRVQHRASGYVLAMRDSRLDVGIYDVYCTIQFNNEPLVSRIISFNLSGRDDAFLLSGMVNELAPYFWASFEVAHIFPLEAENLWIEWGYGCWVTNLDDANGVSKINSCQNGFLLEAGIHRLFDQYLVSINPDDGYKVVMFTKNMYGIEGRTLEIVRRDPADPNRVSDELLRWHFQQSVLANMKGAGEPVFEHDFPPGTDMVKEISEGPHAKERFELEMAARLRGVY
ncbi:hypothetical protein BGX38DRAFT_1251983 [Terfezia claveryi]|nr:hypothetical protein BGX38DRAFT_1251983 [Terfezia claveryi]